VAFVARDRDEGNDIDRAEPGVDPRVLCEVDERVGATSDAHRRIEDALSTEAEHRSVVPLIAVHIKKGRTRASCNVVDDLNSAALADIDDAREHVDWP
jgi:hypothetical protein